jgi:hypothetical protein
MITMRRGRNALSKSNNFTLARLVLASSSSTRTLLLIVTGSRGATTLEVARRTDLRLRVDGFFFLSGYLVYPRLLGCGEGSAFMLARLARLCPAWRGRVGTRRRYFLTTQRGPGYFGAERLGSCSATSA